MEEYWLEAAEKALWMMNAPALAEAASQDEEFARYFALRKLK